MADKIQDTRQEWHDFVNSEEARDRRRTGMPTSLALHDMGLYTMIGRGDKDARGAMLERIYALYNGKVEDMGP